MKKNRVSEFMIAFAGILMILSSFAHAFPGWAALHNALMDSTDPAILAAVGIGWHLGSISMAAFGVLGIISAVQLRKGNMAARWVPLVIGITILLFGMSAMFYRGFKPHFILFATLGILLLAGALIWSPAQEPKG